MHSPEAAMTKDDLYDKLVADRIACRRCEASGLTNPSTVSGGRFDSPEIGPWSRWQGGLVATLMIVGQDWGTVEYFSEHAGLVGPRVKNPTNEALRAPVRELGIAIGPPGDLRRDGVAPPSTRSRTRALSTHRGPCESASYREAVEARFLALTT